MTKLAINGGSPAVTGELAPFRTIGREEAAAASAAVLAGALSGYLGGERHGGLRVEALEAEWCEIFGVRHAVSCNSATSGLMLAALACGVDSSSTVVTTPFSMSATAAAPAFLGADIVFGDIDPDTFCLEVPIPIQDNCKAIIVTNLFGHPAMLRDTREICEMHDLYLIEDNAQAPFAKEYGSYAGTVGHIGVFSLNVHKHLHCGEGGICVTDDDDLAESLRRLRNHGELFDGNGSVGLNLRLTEVSAAIALAQLAKREAIMSERIEIAETLSDMVKDLPGITAPVVREGCEHVYYCVPFKLENRDWTVDALVAEGVPLRKGYVEPLYHLPAFQRFERPCPVAERAHQQLGLWENCAYTPTAAQLKQIGEAFKKVLG